MLREWKPDYDWYHKLHVLYIFSFELLLMTRTILFKFAIDLSVANKRDKLLANSVFAVEINMKFDNGRLSS